MTNSKNNFQAKGTNHENGQNNKRRGATPGKRGVYKYLKYAVPLVVTAIVLIGVVHYLSSPGSKLNKVSTPLPANIGVFVKISSTPSLMGGKVPVLLIASEACPYCAAESWAIYKAMASYGTWTGVQYIESNSSDIFPNTPGLTFLNSAYESPSVVFNGFEVSNRNWEPLQKLNFSDQELFSEYDQNKNIPFVLIGDVYLLEGSSYSPGLLKNLTPTEIMKNISSNYNNNYLKAIDNGSNMIEQVIHELENFHSSLVQLDNQFQNGSPLIISTILRFYLS